MDILSLVGSQNELKLAALETILNVVAVNLAVVFTVTLAVCLTNLLLSLRKARN